MTHSADCRLLLDYSIDCQVEINIFSSSSVQLSVVSATVCIYQPSCLLADVGLPICYIRVPIYGT